MKIIKIRWLVALWAVLLARAAFALDAGDAAPNKPKGKEAEKALPAASPTTPAKATDSGSPAPPRAGESQSQQPIRQVRDPQAIKKAADRVLTTRDDAVKALEDLRTRVLSGGDFDWKAERETLEVYRDKIIPLLRKWREEILKNKAAIMEKQLAYLTALEDTILALSADAQQTQAKVKLIKSPIVRDQLLNLTRLRRGL